MLDFELWNGLYNKFETLQEPFWVNYQNKPCNLGQKNKKRFAKAYKRMKNKQQRQSRKQNR